MFDHYPRVAVLICTYDREKEFITTLTSLHQNLKYPRSRLSWFACDDASPNQYVERLRQYDIVRNLKVEFVQQPSNGGWGKNVTAGLIRAYRDAPYVYFTEDDYVVQREIDLEASIALMEYASPEVGMVRYRGTAGTDVTYTQHECDITRLLPEYRQAHGYVKGKITYLNIEPHSPSLYLYSNGPHLKSHKFHEWFGYYLSGVSLGSTEEHYAHTVKDRMIGGYPRITILPEWIPMQFLHIGETYQLTSKDKYPRLQEKS